MKRGLVLAAVGLIAFLGAVPGRAEEHDETSDDQERRFTIHGEVRTRWEYLSNYNDLVDHDDDPALDDDGNFFPYRARIAAHGEFSDNVFGHIEIQNFGFFGNESPQRSEGDPIGQAFQNSIDDSEIQLYQAFIELRDIGETSWSARIGRQEHTLGNELHLGDADFYNGTAFDGLRTMAEFESWDLDLFYYEVFEADAGALFAGAPALDDDVTLSGATAGFNFLNQRIEPYVLFLRDGDYTDLGGKIWTVGAQWGRSVMSVDDANESAWDWNAELAWQKGTFEPNDADLDISGGIFEGWLGYNFTHGDNGRSRIHVGALWASGDDDPLDDELEAYVPLFPDEHAHNRLGDLDLFGGATAVGAVTGGISNVTDLNAGWEWFGGEDRHSFLAAAHWLTLTEEDQVGADDDSIGTELDLRYRYWYNRNTSLEVGVANLFPGDALDELANLIAGENADDVRRVWAQARLRW